MPVAVRPQRVNVDIGLAFLKGSDSVGCCSV